MVFCVQCFDFFAEDSNKSKSETEVSDNKKIDEKAEPKIIEEKKKTLPNISSFVDFKGIFDNIDLQYNTVGYKVKENIIINKPTDKIIFTMKDPFMYDSKLVTSDNIKMSLSETKKGYTLTLSADRVYPITIDPDVQTSQNVKDILRY